MQPASPGRLLCISLPAAGIHLREKNIAGPTERSEYAYAYSKLVGQELRFSMKMMPAPDIVLGSLSGLIPMQLAGPYS